MWYVLLVFLIAFAVICGFAGLSCLCGAYKSLAALFHSDDRCEIMWVDGLPLTVATLVFAAMTYVAASIAYQVACYCL